MENNSGTFLILVVLGFLVVLLVTIKLVEFLTGFSDETRYLMMEINSAEDDGEYRYWRRMLSCHYLTLIPFVNEKNAGKLYRLLFKKPKHAAKKEGFDGLYHLIAPSIIGAVVCTICLCGASWAWFTASQTSHVTQIRSAKYTVSAELKNGADTVELTVNGEGVYLKERLAAGSYTLVLKPNGTATTGYCKIVLGDHSYYTEQITLGEDLTVTADFTVTVNVGEETVFQIIPQWGSCGEAVKLADGGSIS